jgi:hypothetical protein
MEESSFTDRCSDEDEVVFFDDPFCSRCLTNVLYENTSIDISESIKSNNVPSVEELMNESKRS